MSITNGTSAPGRTGAAFLEEREELVSVRAAGWRMLVPLRHVERVLPAVMPAARPGAGPNLPLVGIGGELVPLVFAGALLGASDVALGAEQQMLLLAGHGLRALLWVDAVEDVLGHAAARPPAGAAAGGLVLAWSGAERPLAVLDVPRLLALANRDSSEGEA